jgi:hypothetical protein
VVRVLFIVVCFVLAGAPASLAAAQAGDFAGEIQPTLPANEQLVGQITDAIPSSDLDTLVAQTGLTLGVGEDLQNQFNTALALAPDDAARSRLEGLIAHTQAVLDSLNMIRTADNLDVARGRLDQARGEAQEGLNELRPFVLQQQPVPAVGGK